MDVDTDEDRCSCPARHRRHVKLLVSSPGEDVQLGGGLLAVGENDFAVLDTLPTTGMCVSPDRSRIARLTWVADNLEASELTITDRGGLLTYRRLDDVGEPHSLLWVEDTLYAVSTGSNAVVALTESGAHSAVLRPLGAPTAGDCWHLNSLALRDDRLHVSGFGMFPSLRGWSEPGALRGAGFVLDLTTDRPALTGLSAPHDPVWVDDSWIVCNSYDGAVARYAPDGRCVRSSDLGGWTRGVLDDGEVIYVGVSAHRLAPPVDRARIAVLDRDTLEEVGRMPLPTRDVFSLCPYVEELADGLRVGAQLGALRMLGTRSVVMDHPLHVNDSLASTELVAATSANVSVRVRNRSAAVWSSAGAHPVRLGARWWNERESSWVDAGRCDLEVPLHPGRETTMHIQVSSLPPHGGHLRIGVLQELVRWFDDVDPASAVELQLG